MGNKEYDSIGKFVSQIYRSGNSFFSKAYEEEAYIYRNKSSIDKRANIIGLTEKALSIKEDFFEVHRQWEEKITSILAEDERELTLILLKKIASSETLRRN